MEAVVLSTSSSFIVCIISGTKKAKLRSHMKNLRIPILDSYLFVTV